jgi:hypothetical protein
MILTTLFTTNLTGTDPSSSLDNRGEPQENNNRGEPQKNNNRGEPQENNNLHLTQRKSHMGSPGTELLTSPLRGQELAAQNMARPLMHEIRLNNIIFNSLVPFSQ